MEPQNPAVPSAPAPLLTTNLKGPIELVREAWALYKSNWKVLLAIMLIPPVVMGVATSLLAIGSIGLGIVGFVIMIVAAILFISMQGAIIDAVRRADTNPTLKISVKAQYSFGLSLFWSFVLLAIINAFINLGSAILLIIPGIIVSVYTMFYLFAFVIDGKKGFSAMVESFLVVRGRWWKTLGRVVFLVIIYLVAFLVARGLGFLIAGLFGFAPQSDGYELTIAVLTQVLGIIVGPLIIIYMYKLYQSLKETRSAVVSGSTFKKWLVAFVVIGALVVPIGIFSSVVLASLNAAREKAEVARQQAEMRLQTTSVEETN